jgi:hypothetical protein
VNRDPDSVFQLRREEVALARLPYARLGQRVLAITAVLFGAVTILAGARVLAGSDPGYVVFSPLVIYNTAMGFVYVGVGAVAWRSLRYGRNGAAAIFLLNLLVLAAIWILYLSGGAVATDSLRAMAFRTVVWLVLLVGFLWVSREGSGTDGQVR